MSVAVNRLTVEAGKYHGKTAGETIPRSEVVAQAEAEGYTSREASAILEGEGTTIEIPDQGDLFGDLWPGNQSADSAAIDNPCENETELATSPKIPEPLDEGTEDHYALHEPIALSSEDVARDRYLDDGQPVTAYEAVGQYFKRRSTDATSRETQGFVNDRRGTAESQYKRGMALNRQLLDQFENPTLTMLSLRVSPNPENRLTLLEGLGEGVDATLYKLRRRLEEDTDAPLACSEWEYIVVFAGTRKRATPHAHILVYTEGDVSRDRFEDVVGWFVKKCPYAVDDGAGNSPEGDVISIRGNGDEAIPRVDDASSELRETVDGANSQAAAYAFPQLPHLGAVGGMELDELLHAATHDAYAGSAFRASVAREDIESRYMPTGYNPCRNRTDQSGDPEKAMIQAVAQFAQMPSLEAHGALANSSKSDV